MIASYTKHCIEAAIGKSRPKALSKALASLHSHYTPILKTSFLAIPGGADFFADQANQLAAWLTSRDKSDYVMEIFQPKNDADTLIFVEIRNITALKTDFGKKYHKKSAGYLIIYGFAKTDDGKSRVSAFRKALAKAIAKAFALKREPKIASIGLINKKMEELSKKKNSTPTIPGDLVPALELLTDSQFRNVVIRTRQAKDPTLENIAKSTGLPSSAVEPILTRGVDNRVLTKQYNVVCTKCGNVLARVASVDAIAQMQKDQVSCPGCKTVVQQDSHVDAYSVSDQIDPILTGSEWMHMYLRKKIDPFLPTGTSITSVIDGPNELDLVANVDGDLLLAELKDSRFSIGHAYSFVGKCSQYQPDLAVIVATEGVDDDVKEYVKNTGIATHYIEHISDIEDALARILSERNSQRLAQLLGEVSWKAFVTKSVLGHFNVSLPIPREPYGYPFPEGRFPSWTLE